MKWAVSNLSFVDGQVTVKDNPSENFNLLFCGGSLLGYDIAGGVNAWPVAKADLLASNIMLHLLSAIVQKQLTWFKIHLMVQAILVVTILDNHGDCLPAWKFTT